MNMSIIIENLYLIHPYKAILRIRTK